MLVRNQEVAVGILAVMAQRQTKNLSRREVFGSSAG
nr:MAG TPA: hypothetical protein [Caudoviricetes sp.]